MERIISLFGIVVFVAIAFFLSSKRKEVRFNLILRALFFQFALAVCLIGIPSLNLPGFLSFIFHAASNFFLAIIRFADEGANFVAGPLVDPAKANGYIFAVKVLPVVVFFSSLMSVLYHYGIMQKIVGGFAKIMHKILPISGAEALASSANIFIGQTEAPLVIAPYVQKMTRSELNCLMVGGMATVAGGVLAAFVDMLSPFVKDIGGHLLTASVLSAPAAIMYAKIMVPETEEHLSSKDVFNKDHNDEKKSNAIEAAAAGASTGMKMAINIVAMLIAFIALVALLNGVLSYLGEFINFSNWGNTIIPDEIWSASKGKLSLEMILSILFLPFAFLLGIPFSECAHIAGLLGEKVIINEFYAYIHLAQIGEHLSEKSIIVASYALCGFANFSSIGIQLGGIGEIAPNRRKDIAQLGIKALIGGSFAAFTTACIANILL